MVVGSPGEVFVSRPGEVTIGSADQITGVLRWGCVRWGGGGRPPKAEPGAAPAGWPARPECFCCACSCRDDRRSLQGSRCSCSANTGSYCEGSRNSRGE